MVLNNQYNKMKKTIILSIPINWRIKLMKFEFAKITKSRLMGSLGLHIKWKDDKESLNQFFLLDSEEEGIADYVGIRNATYEEIFIEENRLMGGLGSSVIRILKKEALSLLYEYGRINIKKSLSFPGVFPEYEYLLKRDTTVDEYELFMKTCIKISSAVEFINYMTMRLVARDNKALRFFSSEKEPLYPQLSSNGAALLKNNVSKMSDNRYFSNAIIEDPTGYYKIKLGFTIIEEDEFKLRSILASEKQPIDNETLRELINRPEYIANFKIQNQDVLYELKKSYPTLYKVPFEKGDMYTKFKPHNDHVKETEYRISDDLEAIFFKNEKEIVFAALDKKTYKVGFKLLESIPGLILNNEFVFSYPVIYDFAESDFDKFSNFLEDL